MPKMKDLSNKITEVLKATALSQRKKFGEIAESINVQETSVNDINFAELIQELNDGLDIVQASAKKGILDLLPSHIRQALSDSITALEVQANNLFISKAQGNDVAPFVSVTNTILNIISSYSLDILLKNFPDYSEKLLELKDLRKQLAGIITEFNGSKKIIEEAKNLLETLSETYAKNSEAYNAIASLKANIEKINDEINAKNLEGERIINAIRLFNQTFEGYVKSITDEATGFQATINFVEKIKADIAKIYDEAGDLNKKLKDNIVTYEVSIKSLKNIETSIQTLYDQATDPEEGIEVKLKYINTTKSQVDDLYSKIKQSHTVSGELEGKIKTLHDASVKNASQIETAKTDSEDKRNKIGEIYNIVANLSRGGMFDKARGSFEGQQSLWLKFLVGSVLITTGVAIWITYLFYDKSLSANPVANVIIRYAILSPLIFAIIFCGRQYKLSRTSFEKYTFKTVLSLSLEADITVMQNRFPDKKNESLILESTLEKLTKLYDEPYYDEITKLKYKVIQDEIKFGASHKEIKKNAKTTG